MWIPWRNELDEVFRRDKAIGLKAAGGAAVAVYLVIHQVLKMDRQGGLEEVSVTTTGLILLGIGSAVLGACLALSLSLRDVVRRRLDRGARVHPLLVLVFGSRMVGVTILAVLIMGAIIAFGG